MKRAAITLAFCLIAVPAMGLNMFHQAVGPPHQGAVPRDACWVDAPDVNGLIASSEQILTYGLESEVANDFVPTNDVSHLTAWTGYWNNSTPCATGIAFPGLNIRIYDDAGCVPGGTLYDISPTVNETSYGCQSGTYPMFEDNMDVAFNLTAGNLYWCGVQVADHAFPPQGGRLASVGVQGCDSVFKSAFFGYPDWTAGIDVFGVAFDASQLFICAEIPPTNTGACCIGDQGECRVMDPSDCDAQNGEYQGDWSTCDPNPCIPVPTKSTTWGQIKGGYR